MGAIVSYHSICGYVLTKLGIKEGKKKTWSSDRAVGRAVQAYLALSMDDSLAVPKWGRGRGGEALLLTLSA